MLKLIENLGRHYPTENSKQKASYGLYECPICLSAFRTRIDGVKSGHTSSCGCTKNTTHKLSKHTLFKTWKNMIERTSNPKNKSYATYGGRGITVCEEWINPKSFIDDMFPTYITGLSLDRIDNDKGYSKDNCRWVKKEIQSRNTSVLRSTNTSGYRGICFNKRLNKWSAQIRVDKVLKHLGLFTTDKEAAKAYDQYVLNNSLEHTINGVV